MPQKSFYRELIVAMLTVVVTSLIGIVGWTIHQGVHLAVKEQTVDSSAARLDKIENRLQAIPANIASQEQITSLREQQARDHFDTMTAIGRIDSRIDDLLSAARFHRAIADPQPARSGGGIKLGDKSQ